MDTLPVETQKLKQKYVIRDLLWKILIKKICKFYALGWKDNPLISFPLATDIELGTIKYYYYKYGLKLVLTMILKYNEVILGKMNDELKPIDISEFYVTEILTSDKEISNQLNNEIDELCSTY